MYCNPTAYEIYNASHLLWFAGLVNGTLEGTAQNQSANAILMADIDMSAVTDYVPIGGTTGLYYSTEGEDKGYQGIFDGNGHVIKNLSVTGSNVAQLTYGVFGTLSRTVKHLGVENFTFSLGSQDCRAGGIAGQMLSGGLIEDCYVANSTITATGKVAGGIAGCNYAGTIKNCFTYKVTVTASRTGGIVSDNCGDNNSDRKGSIINCYTDASAIESSSRKGNVSNSTAGISESDFTSGLVGYLLDGSRNLWKQTIGSQDYPTFNGATIKVDGYNIAGSVISAKITWTAMEFTYTYSAGTWNPDTHSYSGSSGVWSVVDGGGAITVENKGEQDFYSAFGFTSIISGITGEFDIKSQLLKSGTSVTSKLTISGTPAESGFSNLPLGTAKVALSKNQPAAVWNVGDKVTYIADDGETYTCVVISKSNGVCTLITDSYVLDDSAGKSNQMQKLQSTGGRLPNGSNSAEMDALRARCRNSTGGTYIDGST